MAAPSFWRLGSRLRAGPFKLLCNSLMHLKSNPLPDHETQQQNVAKPFNEIPGPLSLPFIGTIYLYLFGQLKAHFYFNFLLHIIEKILTVVIFFVEGTYSFEDLHKTGFKKYQKYGSLVREEIMPGNSIVWIFDPNDMERMFLSEAQQPQRRSHLAVGVFRKDRPDVYNTGGLLHT